MKYSLIFDKLFKKDLDKLNRRDQERISKKIFDLKTFPELGKHLVGIDLWSLRVGKFRVIYKIEEGRLLVLLLRVGHRKNIYEEIHKLK